MIQRTWIYSPKVRPAQNRKKIVLPCDLSQSSCRVQPPRHAINERFVLPLPPLKSRCKWVFAAAICHMLCVPNLYAQTPGTGAAPTSSKIDAKVMQLQKIDVKQGTGTEATAGKAVIVHYTGWLYDPAATGQKGAKFDSSRDRQVPFGFMLGAGKVIRGWDEGVAGMKVGGQRTLIIPADMGYGSRGAGGVIPPDAMLIFDVELIEVKG